MLFLVQAGCDLQIHKPSSGAIAKAAAYLSSLVEAMHHPAFLLLSWNLFTVQASGSYKGVFLGGQVSWES